MPRRRRSIAPQREIDALTFRVDSLQRQVMQLTQAGPSTIQTDDGEKVLDPVQGQITLNHKGTHRLMEPEDPIVYYHDNAMRGIGVAEESARSWAFVYNTNPLLRSTDSNPTPVPSFNTDFMDSDVHLTLDGNNRILIQSPGMYYVEATVAFGIGGVSTGNAISVRAQIQYDWDEIDVSGPHSFRWLHRIIGGASEGAGYGPTITVHRGGGFVPPFADSDAPPSMHAQHATTQMGVCSGMLAIQELPSQAPIDLQLDDVRNSSGLFTNDAFYHSVAVVRMGRLPSTSGGTGYL